MIVIVVSYVTFSVFIKFSKALTTVDFFDMTTVIVNIYFEINLCGLRSFVIRWAYGGI